MPERKLTPRMVAVLKALGDGRGKTPADIAYEAARWDPDILKPVHRARGPWSGTMSPAQRVISSIRALPLRG